MQVISIRIPFYCWYRYTSFHLYMFEDKVLAGMRPLLACYCDIELMNAVQRCASITTSSDYMSRLCIQHVCWKIEFRFINFN